MEKNKIEVLYISYDGLTDPLGQSQVLPYVIGLSKQGYNFTIISCDKRSNYIENYDIVKEIVNKNNIEWISLTYHKKPPVLSTLYDVYGIWKAASNLVFKKNIKIVHCRSYIPSLIGLNLKKKYDIKFIFDMRGFWADERVEGRIWNTNNVFYNSIYTYFKRKEKKFLQESDYIISLTEKAKEIITGWNHSYKNKIKVIPCCVDITHFNNGQIIKQDITRLKEELEIPSDSFILSYLGSIGTWYLADDMLNFFKQFILKGEENGKKSIFLFITPDSKEYIYNSADKIGIPRENIRVVKAPKSLVPQFLALSDYSIFFIKPSFSKQASSPTKQGEIMAMGIPIICNVGIGDTDEIIKNTESGILIEQFNIELYKDIIDKIHSGFYSWQPEKIRDSAIDYFSLEKGVEMYSEVYRKLI